MIKLVRKIGRGQKSYKNKIKTSNTFNISENLSFGRSLLEKKNQFE